MLPFNGVDLNMSKCVVNLVDIFIFDWPVQSQTSPNINPILISFLLNIFKTVKLHLDPLFIAGGKTTSQM